METFRYLVVFFGALFFLIWLTDHSQNGFYKPSGVSCVELVNRIWVRPQHYATDSEQQQLDDCEPALAEGRAGIER